MCGTRGGGAFDVALLEQTPGFAVLRLSGPGARALAETEPGGHRVQRIPPTEKRGRVQTSTVTVAVLAASTVTVGGRTFPTREAFELVYLIGVIAAAIGVVLITLILGRRTAPTTQGRAPAPVIR